MNAYSELYLPQAQRNLGRMVDYAVYDLKQDSEYFIRLFSRSMYGKRFEGGDVSVIAGLSGTELARRVLDECRYSYLPVKPMYTLERSREYWAGWALAYFQWKSGLPFRKILDTVPFREIISLYTPYHEMSIGHFCDYLSKTIRQRRGETALKCFRTANEMTQKELAELTGISLRTIQQYEQRQKSIDRAGARTLQTLAHALNCDSEELLEEI